MITRKTSQRLFDFSLRLAERRKKRGKPGLLTCVDKANAFKAYAYFRSIFDERAKSFPNVKTDHVYVDACAALMVRKPWEFDVMVMENIFGDILSDLAAGLIGGLGIAPSADIGDKHGRQLDRNRPQLLARHLRHLARHNRGGWFLVRAA